MIGFAPTRINLLSLKKRLAWAMSGAQLLKNKREALMKEFFSLVKGVAEVRKKLDETTKKATRGLMLSKAFAGEDVLASSSLASEREGVSVDISIENIWGINIPEIKQKSFKRAVDARGFSPVGESLWTLSVADMFEDVVTLIVEVASHESRLIRLGEEIKSATRKINAIEESLVPLIRDTIKKIEGALEEREREEIFRLKRFKKKRRSI